MQTHVSVHTHNTLPHTCTHANIHTYTQFYTCKYSKASLITRTTILCSCNYVKFASIRVTKFSCTYGSQWLYVGTDKNYVLLVRVEGLALSAYSISYNEVAEM